MEKFRVVITSPPHKERLVAEIYYEYVQWVEISHEIPDDLIIQFYSYPEKNSWEFSYEDALKNLELAREGLLGMDEINDKK